MAHILNALARGVIRLTVERPRLSIGLGGLGGVGLAGLLAHVVYPPF